MTSTAFVAPSPISPLWLGAFRRSFISGRFHKQRASPARILRASLTAETPDTSSSPSPPPSTTQPSSESPSCFGRGKQFPRRAVGLYELEREGINPKAIIAEDSRTEAAFAAVVGLMVFSLVVFPMITPGASVEGPLALIAGVGMTAWAVDALSLGGVGGRALALSLQDRKRVGLHEAGHFLVGFLLGFQVEGYSLPSPKTVLQMKDGGSGPGVRFGECRASGDAHCVSAVGMAGIAGEVLKYGESEGGAADMADVSRGIRNCYGGNKVEPERLKGIVRWGLIEAVQLLKEHGEAHEALCEAMMEGRPVEECVQVVEEKVDGRKLAEKKSVLAAGV